MLQVGVGSQQLLHCAALLPVVLQRYLQERQLNAVKGTHKLRHSQQLLVDVL
jgi:hypothetical protein